MTRRIVKTNQNQTEKKEDNMATATTETKTPNNLKAVPEKPAKAVKNRRPLPAVSATDYVRAHQTSANWEEVSKKTGLPVEVCRNRATNYRTVHGIPLKLMPGARGGGLGKSPLDVEALKKLAAEAGPTAPVKLRAEKKAAKEAEKNKS